MRAIPGCAARVRAVAPAVLFAVFGWASALAQVQQVWDTRYNGPDNVLDPDALDKWHVRQSSLANSLLGVASSPNGFVAVGDPGAILVSPDGHEWAPRASGINVTLFDIAFGNETLVAVGNGAPILTSQDGSNWVKRVSATNLYLYDVTFGDGRFVAVGEEGMVQASLDAGVNWQAGSSRSNRSLNGVAYGHGQFVAVGGGGVILVSTNGLDWMPPRSATNVTLYSVAYGAGTFVTVGENRTILTSPDGMNWTRQTVPPGNGSLFLDVIYANGAFACGGVNGTLLSSINGVDWTTRTFPTESHIQGLAFDGETFVAACFGTTNVIFQSDPVYPRPPRIIRPPRDTLVRLGSTTSLTVTAVGTSPFMYRWRRDGVPLPGATNQMLTFSNTQVSAEGSYSVTVENALGTTTSTSALLSVGVPPSIVLQPLDQEVAPGGLAAFSIEVNGTAPLSYRWRQPGTIYTMFSSLGRQSFWTVTNVGAAHAGTYGVLVSNDFGFVLSRGAQLAILTDTDADGLPDRWENEHGLNTNDVADAMLDPDADGMTNLEEYHAGTNPTNAASALRIRTTLANGMLSIEFDAESNKTYTVQQNVTLDPVAWNKLIDLAARTNHRIETVTDPSIATNRYYRVVTPRQP